MRAEHVLGLPAVHADAEGADQPALTSDRAPHAASRHRPPTHHPRRGAAAGPSRPSPAPRGSSRSTRRCGRTGMSRTPASSRAQAISSSLAGPSSRHTDAGRDGAGRARRAGAHCGRCRRPSQYRRNCSRARRRDRGPQPTRRRPIRSSPPCPIVRGRSPRSTNRDARRSDSALLMVPQWAESGDLDCRVLRCAAHSGGSDAWRRPAGSS